MIKNGAKEVVIVDIAIGQLRSAKIRKEKHNLDRLELILRDAEDLPFKDKVFDLGCIFMALHHFQTIIKAFTRFVESLRK